MLYGPALRNRMPRHCGANGCTNAIVQFTPMPLCNARCAASPLTSYSRKNLQKRMQETHKHHSLCPPTPPPSPRPDKVSSDRAIFQRALPSNTPCDPCIPSNTPCDPSCSHSTLVAPSLPNLLGGDGSEHLHGCAVHACDCVSWLSTQWERRVAHGAVQNGLVKGLVKAAAMAVHGRSHPRQGSHL